jgi:hypothetical protein
MVSDSGRKKKIASRFRKETEAATKAGRLYPHWLSVPPTAGPMIKPNPKAAPISPRLFARFFSSVISVM